MYPLTHLPKAFCFHAIKWWRLPTLCRHIKGTSPSRSVRIYLVQFKVIVKFQTWWILARMDRILHDFHTLSFIFLVYFASFASPHIFKHILHIWQPNTSCISGFYGRRERRNILTTHSLIKNYSNNINVRPKNFKNVFCRRKHVGEQNKNRIKLNTGVQGNWEIVIN